MASLAAKPAKSPPGRLRHCLIAGRRGGGNRREIKREGGRLSTAASRAKKSRGEEGGCGAPRVSSTGERPRRPSSVTLPPPQSAVLLEVQRFFSLTCPPLASSALTRAVCPALTRALPLPPYSAMGWLCL